MRLKYGYKILEEVSRYFQQWPEDSRQSTRQFLLQITMSSLADESHEVVNAAFILITQHLNREELEPAARSANP